jgi:carbamoyl-phosphate synthase small subunit
VYITSQNHGFAVRDDTGSNEFVVSEINVNDHTVEGMYHRELPIFSMQYHPEASPGPHDSMHMFEKFIDVVKNAEKK